MPEIIVTAAVPEPGQGDREMVLRERVNAADFESECFAANLLERIEWAVRDATEVERPGRITGRVKSVRRSVPKGARESTQERSPEPVGTR
jgi:hypothetical protein